MILNRKINSIWRYWLSLLYRGITRLSVLLLLSACGGGLSGSGDGGFGGTTPVIPLPDGFEPAYHFRHVPERLIAKFPTSLANNGTSTEQIEATPFNVLTSTVGQLIDSKLELGLLQLTLEANWLKIVEHCSATSEDSDCDLTDAGLSTRYTASMASWEFLLRAGIALENLGDVDDLTEELKTDIIEQVNAKIGTLVSIESGFFTIFSTGSYRYEYVITADLGFSEKAYTLRWSNNKDLTFISLAAIDTVDNLQSSTNSNEASNDFSNAILMTTFKNGIRRERQLNLNQPFTSKELGIESKITEIRDSTKTDYYSIGNANYTGGYISSRQSSTNETDSTVSTFFRETFTEDASIESQSICRIGSSETQCDAESRWDIISSHDPILSQFFLSSAQLHEVEERLTPFDLNIHGVSFELDTLLLIRRENLMFTFTEEGVTVTLPGLGTINLSNNSSIPSTISHPDDQEAFVQDADSILCRVNTEIIGGQTQYRSFCAGTTAEIETALVIGESFREGKLVFEWQANAIVTIVED